MFVDEIDVTFIAGSGGAGKASFYPGYKSGPNGGNGGNGGNVYVSVTSDLTTLNQFSGKPVKKAADGQPGQAYKKTGRNGHDITLILPIGSQLTDQVTKEIIKLDAINQFILVCKGGQGGRGTYDLASPSNTTPLHGEPGQPGQERHFHIELKLIADFGLIGLPNAGKSSLLNELTSANVKVANYPFTTLEPNLGVLRGKIIADIPGLIEGASEGKGLGIKFLKHIEKVKMLLHCISCESEDVVRDYKTVRNELNKYNPVLDKKREIILLTKTDIYEKDGIRGKYKALQKFGNVLMISLLDVKSIRKLKELLL